MKITGIVATIGDDQFTREQLQKLSDSSKGVPVTMNFDQTKKIGQVIGSEITDKGLQITAEVSADISGMFLVPGYQTPEFKLVTYGATLSPQDKTLPKI